MQATRVAVKALVMLFVTAGFAVAQTVAGQPDAQDLLSSVEQTYRAMTTYSAKSTAAVEMNGTNMQSKMEIPTTIAGDSSGRYRMETKGMVGMVVVFDGADVWFYTPQDNKYFKRSVGGQASSAAPGADAIAAGMGAGFGASSFASYKHLTGNVKDAKLLRSETLHIGGSDVQCWVISVEYGAPDLSSVQTGCEQNSTAMSFDPSTFSLARTLWVDKDRYLVYREDSTTKMTLPALGGPTETSQSVKYESVTVDPPLPEDTFTFTPPPGATEMDFKGLKSKTPSPK